MKVYEARALNRRVAQDLEAAHTAVLDSVQKFQALIAPHGPSESNTIYATILQRSLEVAAQELHKARKEATGG